MAADPNDDIACLCTSETCFFLPFFQERSNSGSKDQTQWGDYIDGTDVTPDQVKALAAYADKRINRCAELMSFLLKMDPDWEVIPRSEGVYMESDAVKYEDILPALNAAGFTGEDFVIFSEYTRKWGI